jgi:hypothetical protein
MRQPVLLLTLALVTPSLALASDGVLEINQTCAVQTGCFAGDAPGFPVTVDGASPRSLRLTSDLIVPDENTDAIFIGASNTTLDLGGFEIRGVVSCTGGGATLSCLPAGGTGIGVNAFVGPVRAVRVINGGIRGMGSHGILLGVLGTVENVRSFNNGGDGILVTGESNVSQSTSRRNGGAGILAGSGSTVLDSRVAENGGAGIEGAFGMTIDRNAVYANGGIGIDVGDGSAVLRNSVSLNSGNGIVADSDSLVDSSTAKGNGGSGIVVAEQSLVSNSVSTGNGVSGIVAGARSSVQRSLSRGNTGGEGLSLDATATYREVTTGTVSGGIDMGGNSCNGTSSCP